MDSSLRPPAAETTTLDAEDRDELARVVVELAKQVRAIERRLARLERRIGPH